MPLLKIVSCNNFFPSSMEIFFSIIFNSNFHVLNLIRWFVVFLLARKKYWSLLFFPLQQCAPSLMNFPSRTSTLILQDLARFLQRHFSCKMQDPEAYLARTLILQERWFCKIDVEKGSGKKWNFKVLSTQKSFSLMSSDLRRELFVQNRNFHITSAFNNIFEKLISGKIVHLSFHWSILFTITVNHLLSTKKVIKSIQSVPAYDI